MVTSTNDAIPSSTGSSTTGSSTGSGTHTTVQLDITLQSATQIASSHTIGTKLPSSSTSGSDESLEMLSGGGLVVTET